MTKDPTPSVMRRKAGAGRPPAEFGAPTATRILQGAVAQAAQDLLALEAACAAVQERRSALAPFAGAIVEHALIALAEGPAGRFGLIVLDPQSLAALIEVQTTGRVAPRPATPRPPTPTDAIMCADFLDRILEELEQRAGAAELPLAPALQGFRYATLLADNREALLALEEMPYRVFDMAVEWGGGSKSGQISLVLPFDPPGQGGTARQQAAGFTEAIRAQVLGAEARLTAVLARREMTLAEISGLQVGSLVRLSAEVLGDVGLEDMLGQVVARGRLGQAAGMRALRLVAAADPAMKPAAGAAASAAAGAALPPPSAPGPTMIGTAPGPHPPAPPQGMPEVTPMAPTDGAGSAMAVP